MKWQFWHGLEKQRGGPPRSSYGRGNIGLILNYFSHNPATTVILYFNKEKIQMMMCSWIPLTSSTINNDCCLRKFQMTLNVHYGFKNSVPKTAIQCTIIIIYLLGAASDTTPTFHHDMHNNVKQNCISQHNMHICCMT